MKDSKIWFKTEQSLKNHAYIAKKLINGSVELRSTSISLCGKNPQENIPNKIFTIKEILKDNNNINNNCDSCRKSLNNLIKEFSSKQIKTPSTKTEITIKNSSIKLYQFAIHNGIETISWEIDLAIPNSKFQIAN